MEREHAEMNVERDTSTGKLQLTYRFHLGLLDGGLLALDELLHVHMQTMHTGCSLCHLWLQPLPLRVAASITMGCSLCRIRLHPGTVAGDARHIGLLVQPLLHRGAASVT